MLRHNIRPAGVWNSLPHSFAQVVTVPSPTHWVFVSGQVAFDESANVVGRGDITKQTRQAFENLERCLLAVGAQLADVVSIRVYLTDINDMSAMQAVRNEIFDVPPASTGIEVCALVHPDLLVEIEAIAATHQEGISLP